MDKIKEKLNALRDENEKARARADDAEALAASLKEELSKKDQEIFTLNNKISNLEMDISRADKRNEELTIAKNESDGDRTRLEELQRKLQMVEEQLEEKERLFNESNEKLRTLELQTEQLDRQCTRLESERTELENKLNEMTEKYNNTKRELENTLQGLEDL